jgi:hypothetical protein
VPVVGFIDDAGKRVKFADIASGKGEWWLPRPLLRALSRSYRSADHYGAGDVISVTTLGNPVQQIRLMQRHDVYVEPLRSLWAMHGTLAHAWLEAGLDPDSGNEVAERRLVIDFEGQLVGGTFDLIERDDESAPWVGQDYKVLGGYKVAKMVNEGAVKGALEYVMQANVYRYMIARPDCREVIAEREPGHATMWRPFEHAGLVVPRWRLVTIARDWTASKYEGTIRPVEPIEIPLIEPERVEAYMRERIALYTAAEMCDDAGLPECSRDETWNGRRCAQWCDAASVCKQFGARKGRRSK